jgi:hypothetical protein
VTVHREVATEVRTMVSLATTIKSPFKNMHHSPDELPSRPKAFCNFLIAI